MSKGDSSSMFGFDDFLVGSGLIGAQGLSSLGSSIGNYYFGGKSEKRSNERTEALTERLMYDQFQLDLKEKDYDYALSKRAYDYSNQEAYRLAEQYAANSASWNVAGLRAAGLNPILAATDGNFRGTFGDVGSFSPSSSGFSFSPVRSQGSNFQMAHGFDFAEALRDVSSAKQSLVQSNIAQETKPDVVSTAKNKAIESAYTAQNAGAQVDKTKAESDLIRAEALRTQAQARQLESSTALNIVNAENAHYHKGVNSLPAAASRLATTVNEYLSPLWSYMKGFVDSSHSAKDDAELPIRLEDGKRTKPNVVVPTVSPVPVSFPLVRPSMRSDDSYPSSHRSHHSYIVR